MKLYIEAFGSILKITLTILLFITLPAVVFTLITSNTPLIKGMRSFVVLTGSMSPNIPAGSIVYTIKKPSYKVGDILAFKQGDVTVTHRITDIKNEGSQFLYQTKGDANSNIDSKLVPETDVLGVSAFRVLNAGKLIMSLKTPQGFWMFLVIPTALFIIFELWNIKKELEREIEKKFRKRFEREFSVKRISDYNYGYE